MKKVIALALIAVMLVGVLAGCTVTTSSTSTSTSTSVEKCDDQHDVSKSTMQIGAKTGDGVASKASSAPAPDKSAKTTDATLAFCNDCGVDIHQLYFASSAADKWGDEWLGDSAPLEDGYTITFKGKFKYAADDTKWDLIIADSKGTTLEFDGLDLTLAKDPKNITFVLWYNDAEETYTATIQ